MPTLLDIAKGLPGWPEKEDYKSLCHCNDGGSPYLDEEKNLMWCRCCNLKYGENHWNACLNHIEQALSVEVGEVVELDFYKIKKLAHDIIIDDRLLNDNCCEKSNNIASALAANVAGVVKGKTN